MNIAEPLSRAFHGVKAVMAGDKHAALSDALREVDRLRAGLAELVKETEAADEEADRLALASPHNIDRIAPMMAATLRGWIGSPADRALERLFKENPEWRNVLKTACETKLALTEGEAREIERKVRQELGDLGFDESDIETHPRLRRVRRELTKWRTLADDCDSGKDADLWKRVTRNL